MAWIGRASGHHDIHRNHRGYRSNHAVASRENSAVFCAIPDGDNNFRIWGGLVRPLQWICHISRDRPGNEQAIGVARGGNELKPESFQIVVGAVESANFELTPDTRARVDLAYVHRSVE